MNTLEKLIDTAWRKECYPSGTVVIIPPGFRKAPHYDLWGPCGVGEKDEEGDDIEAYKIKHRMADGLCSFLNGGPRPMWLNDMVRTSEVRVDGADGSGIVSTGPFYDSKPPMGYCWKQHEEQEWQDARARQIDVLGIR